MPEQNSQLLETFSRHFFLICFFGVAASLLRETGQKGWRYLLYGKGWQDFVLVQLRKFVQK
jgi:hypothetical protein